MELNQFILTLPSNSSSELYKNTKSNFKTKLISTINMPENTVVGLKEIIFPLEFVVSLGKITVKNINGKTQSENITTQTYNSKNFPLYIINLVDAFLLKTGASEITSNGKFYGLKFSQTSGRYNLTLKTGWSVKFEGVVSSLLGFEENKEFKIHDGEIPAPVSLIENNYPSILYVYTDIIEFQYVGDTKAQLIATIPVNTKQSEKISCMTFDNPLYFDVNTNKINTIHIQIKDDQNRFIRFKDGFSKVLIKLEFKQKFFNHI